MASGLIDPYKSKNRPTSQGQAGPYQGNLQTDFSNIGSIRGDMNQQARQWNAMTSGRDRDVRGAADAHYQLTHANEGTNSQEQLALFNMYQGRIKQKNALAEQIHGNDEQKRNSISSIYGTAKQALGQGLKNTRENFNRRGLLYSGLRESGESKVRGGVGAQMSGSIADTNREYANSLEKSKQAYASVGFASAKENMELANQAFHTVNQNNIARMQAFQQFAGGLGQAAGYAYGSQKPGQAEQPAGPSGPSYYDTSFTNNYYDSPRSGLLSERTA